MTMLYDVKPDLLQEDLIPNNLDAISSDVMWAPV